MNNSSVHVIKKKSKCNDLLFLQTYFLFALKSLDNVDQQTNSYLETVPFWYVTYNQFLLDKIEFCSTFLLVEYPVSEMHVTLQNGLQMTNNKTQADCLFKLYFYGLFSLNTYVSSFY